MKTIRLYDRTDTSQLLVRLEVPTDNYQLLNASADRIVIEASPVADNHLQGYASVESVVCLLSPVAMDLGRFAATPNVSSTCSTQQAPLD